MTTPTSATIVNTLVAASCITVGAIAQNLTRAEKDEAQQQEMVRQAECDAISAAYGVDPWRGTSIGTIVRQREESAAASQAEEQAEEQMTLMTADGDDQSEASDEEPTVEEIASSGVTSAGPLSDLFLTNFGVVDGGVQFDFELDSANSVASTVEIFSTTNLTAGVWNHEISDPIPAGVTNHTTFLSWPSSLIPQSFYAYGWPTDSDGDGIIDLYELLVTGTDPNNADTDGDGLSDGREIAMGTNPKNTDSDGDGLDDDVEVSMCINPLLSDSDGDGLSDDDEYRLGTDPNNPDSDGDGINDGDEVNDQRDPTFDEDEMINPPIGDGTYYTVTGIPNITIESRETNDVEDVVLPTIVLEDGGARGVSFNIPWAPKFYAEITGLKFVPSVSGIYEFEIEGDDDATLSVGGVSVEGHYRTTSQGFFKAGIPYAIEATLYNDGGPASFRSSVFGRLVKMYSERFENSFGAKAVIFENSYYNKPGCGIKKRSTYAESRFIITAGDSGGTLNVSGNYNTKLELCAGTDIAPGSYNLEPYETKVFHGLYRGAQASGSIDDVTREIEWQPADGESMNDVASLTVVKVEMEALSNAPANKHRHEFGVCERAKVIISPEVDIVTVDYGNLNIDQQRNFILPNSADEGNIIVSAEGTFLDLPWRSIAPKARVATSHWKLISDPMWVIFDDNGRIIMGPVPPGGCGSGMRFDTKLSPEHVSFGEICFCEGECDAAKREGVYRMSTFDNLKHDCNVGAWKEIEVGADNDCGEDVAACSLLMSDYQPPRDISGFSFLIPEYWYEHKGSSVEQMNLFDHEEQSFKVYPNGAAIIRKFKCSAKRNYDGTYDLLYGL